MWQSGFVSRTFSATSTPSLSAVCIGTLMPTNFAFSIFSCEKSSAAMSIAQGRKPASRRKAMGEATARGWWPNS